MAVGHNDVGKPALSCCEPSQAIGLSNHREICDFAQVAMANAALHHAVNILVVALAADEAGNNY